MGVVAAAGVQEQLGPCGLERVGLQRAGVRIIAGDPLALARRLAELEEIRALVDRQTEQPAVRVVLVAELAPIVQRRVTGIDRRRPHGRVAVVVELEHGVDDVADARVVIEVLGLAERVGAAVELVAAGDLLRDVGVVARRGREVVEHTLDVRDDVLTRLDVAVVLRDRRGDPRVRKVQQLGRVGVAIANPPSVDRLAVFVELDRLVRHEPERAPALTITARHPVAVLEPARHQLAAGVEPVGVHDDPRISLAAAWVHAAVEIQRVQPRGRVVVGERAIADLDRRAEAVLDPHELVGHLAHALAQGPAKRREHAEVVEAVAGQIKRSAGSRAGVDIVEHQIQRDRQRVEAAVAVADEDRPRPLVGVGIIDGREVVEHPVAVVVDHARRQVARE
ncbi:hypothetical protein ENSA7_81690 [Enhygromyxa salina]|uniref:Uncharacterized protein n=1 Tax=Enhygromyxa salina TaxID=215803 RepID=A0A2S9XHA0_9BACT|nr:hypothetical protein ENSA7_81690 [Enhygromyxa salina]